MSAPRQSHLRRTGASSNRGCGTCRDRKISCDLDRPICRNCISSKRTCQGYGLRLSWPAQDSRRSIQYSGLDNSLAQTSPGSAQNEYFINTSMGDVQLLYRPATEIFAKRSIYISPFLPLDFTNIRPSVGDGHHLLTFFMTKVVSSLTPIQTNGYSLGKLFFQLSLSDDSPTSIAVLRAILSLASLYRYGYGEEALRLKTSALESLGKSMNGQVIGTREIYQHVAVGMLICSFETFSPSQSSFQWPLYLSGAKNILHTICQAGIAKHLEVDPLLLWLHYHDILGKFISRHWIRPSAESRSIFNVPGMASALVSSNIDEHQVVGTFGCSLEMLNLISRMSEFHPRHNIRDNLQRTEIETLDSIERELIGIQQHTTYLTGTISTEDFDHYSKTSRLYQLAALIYFEHIFKDASSTGSMRVAKWSAEGFEILAQLSICERPFPLLFIASEAHTDSQRETVISILERTQQRSEYQWKTAAVKRLIESMWVQQDLSADLESMSSRYIDVLNIVISSNELLPSLA